MSGATIRTYLLERSRVCQVADPERNYHCFYLLCAEPKEYKSSCFDLVCVSNAQDYLATMRTMDVVGFSEKEQFREGKETYSSMLKDDKSKFHLQTIAELLIF